MARILSAGPVCLPSRARTTKLVFPHPSVLGDSGAETQTRWELEAPGRWQKPGPSRKVIDQSECAFDPLFLFGLLRHKDWYYFQKLYNTDISNVSII